MDRKSLLFNSFMQDLGGAAHDAQMAYHSCTKDYLHARSKESVAQFLRSYLKYRSSTPWSSPHGMSSDGTTSDNRRPSTIFTLDDVHSMIKFHNSVVEPLARHFANWALQNFSEFPGTHACFDPLTHTEQSHISGPSTGFKFVPTYLASVGELMGSGGILLTSTVFTSSYHSRQCLSHGRLRSLHASLYFLKAATKRFFEAFDRALTRTAPGTSDQTHHMTHLTTKTTWKSTRVGFFHRV